jgi:hypothetical protein
MTTLALVQLLLSAAGPILAALAHYRLNRAAAPAPHLGDGHLLAALRSALTAPPLPAPPAPPTSADLTAQLVALLGQAQAHLAQLAQQPPPTHTGGTTP